MGLLQRCAMVLSGTAMELGAGRCSSAAMFKPHAVKWLAQNGESMHSATATGTQQTSPSSTQAIPSSRREQRHAAKKIGTEQMQSSSVHSTLSSLKEKLHTARATDTEHTHSRLREKLHLMSTGSAHPSHSS